jgi:N-acetylglucosaminyl-diphospho-decaprenol L-rhamnosyltransferase
MPRLTIIIVAYQSRRDLDTCLTALAARPPRTAHEIVVVDNASTDGTTDHLRTRWPGVRVIEAGSNLGFARANNLGIRQTSNELVLLLNPDTVVGQGAIDALVSALDARRDVAVVGPRIVDDDGRAELSWGPMLTPVAEIWQMVLVRGSDAGWPLVRAVVDRRTRQLRTVDWVSGACLLIRRHDLDAVGLLDERYFMYEEDVDLCAAVRRRGRRVLFTPAAEIVHRRGRSAASAPSRTRDAYRRSHLAFYRKHHPRWAPWLVAYLTLRRQLPDTSTEGP